MLRSALVVALASTLVAGATVARSSGSERANSAAPRDMLAFESYEAGGEIVTMRADGTRLRVFARNAREPAWSPDGRWLAYARVPVRRGYPTIMRTRADGTSAGLVSRFAANGPRSPMAAYPSWSPDGSRVVFTAQHEVVDANGETPTNDEGEALTEFGVFSASARGSRPRRLKSDTGYVGPDWSPDGQHIALATSGSRIGVIHAAGGRFRALRRIVNARSRLEFSPDGKQLLLIAGWRPPTINVLDVRTGRRVKTPLADGELLAAATWAPDGKRIAYLAHLGWTTEGGLPTGWSTALFTMRPNGTAKRRVLTVPTYVQGDTLSWTTSARRG